MITVNAIVSKRAVRRRVSFPGRANVYSLFDCDSKGRYPRVARTLIPGGTCRPNGPAGELLVPESRPAGDLHLRPRPHTEPVIMILNDHRVLRACVLRDPSANARTAKRNNNNNNYNDDITHRVKTIIIVIIIILPIVRFTVMYYVILSNIMLRLCNDANDSIKYDFFFFFGSVLNLVI